jgi:hypothetical protein
VARIVPTTVRRFVESDSILSKMIDVDPTKQPELGSLQAFELAALLELLEQIPEELLPRSSDAYLDFILGAGALRHAVLLWRSGDTKTTIKPLKRWGGRNPVSLVYNALKDAPDEAPAPTTKTLAFIKDPAAADILRNDLAAVERAIHNGEWKAATVLAGSVIEALLLWAVSQDAKKAVAANSAPKSKPDINEWNLIDLIKVAHELGLISIDTQKQADLSRGYRNLIHPAVAERKNMVADRPTAFAAFAGMDLVVADLTKRFP